MSSFSKFQNLDGNLYAARTGLKYGAIVGVSVPMPFELTCRCGHVLCPGPKYGISGSGARNAGSRSPSPSDREGSTSASSSDRITFPPLRPRHNRRRLPHQHRYQRRSHRPRVQPLPRPIRQPRQLSPTPSLTPLPPGSPGRTGAGRRSGAGAIEIRVLRFIAGLWLFVAMGTCTLGVVAVGVFGVLAVMIGDTEIQANMIGIMV